MSSKEFKVGDKVKCIDANLKTYLKQGDVYTIKQVIKNSFGEYLMLEEIKEDHDYDVIRFELVEDISKQPKFNIGDKVSTIYGEFEVLWVGVNEHSGKELYVCYQKGFAGHSAIATLRGNDYRDTIYENQCWCFEESDLELVKQPEPDEQPVVKNYREMKPNNLIPISVDGNEFKVPLGDLVHTEHLLGKSTGTYGYTLWNKIHETIDKDNTLLNSNVYPKNTVTFELQKDLFKIYFIDKEKEAELSAKKQSLKESIDKKLEEISKLEKELYSLDES